MNGSIDYEEFVTIAAPMLQTFRAKSLANVCHYDKAIEAVVESSISRDELARLADDCILMLKQSDTIHAGALPAHIIKRKLQKVAALALSANEISMLVQNLPRTSSGLCLYESIRLIIYDVRFQSLKAIILDSQTSDIQQEVSRRFSIEMKRFSKQRIDATPENYGLLPVRVVVDILLNLAAFPLSRLQVIMIINEATIVDEKYINLHHFAPVASRFIEQLFDPNVIKPSHAFENSGSSSKGKDGTSAVDVDDANDMRSKLLLLFQAYDLDFNGVLSYQELLDCVNSLDLALSSAQIQGLVACAFTNPQEEELRSIMLTSYPSCSAFNMS